MFIGGAGVLTVEILNHNIDKSNFHAIHIIIFLFKIIKSHKIIIRPGVAYVAAAYNKRAQTFQWT